MPYLVLTDLDKSECAPLKIEEWLPQRKGKINENLLFRIAVRQVESWVLAHRKAFAAFLGVQEKLIPENPDQLENSKIYLIKIAEKSRNRQLREAIVPAPGSTSHIGPDYNGTLSEFILKQWDVKEALKNSPSLKRAYEAIKSFQPVYGKS